MGGGLLVEGKERGRGEGERKGGGEGMEGESQWLSIGLNYNIFLARRCVTGCWRRR